MIDTTKQSKRLKQRSLQAMGTLFFTALGALTPLSESLAAACNVKVNNDVKVAQKAPGFDSNVMVDEVAAAMQQSNVKGYALNVFNRWGESVASVTHGLARTQCDNDGERTFSLNTETPWGSVSKLLTTAAAIHAVDHNPIDFDDKLVDYLPYRWRSELHPRFQDVTLAMLLQHKAGFRHSGCGRPLRDRLKEGDAVNGCSGSNPRPSVGTKQYSNTGPGIFYVILAYMTRPDFMHTIDFGYQNHSDAVYDSVIQGYTASIYNDYVEDNVLAPVGVSATCNMADNAGGNYTLWYSSANDSSGSMPSDQSGHCSSGGWIMSSNEMTRVLSRLGNSEDILSRESYKLMESSWEDSLGWWRVGPNQRPHFSHNGAWGSTRSQVYSLQGGYTATLVTNSPPANGVSLGGLLMDAYENAREKGVGNDAIISAKYIME
ncbi:serine hydrolase [Pleionea sp. CnH1-48]|uniref:serine hydrolase domain-containing protein n=1 Tax=Pleionea sp. CnH1-48 TaxID=2954494 RepID=UPI0020978B56|nr:serine hydrolase domain-containing protein [Pleionea sp. CnH1-48]MCO7225496.1 beta-lactamase family protein [Pleionea sp. CnH1-48]